jgi:tetratricopeptide (TPR) repeat protein
MGAPARDESREEALELRARTLYAAGEYRQAVDIYARLYAETLHPTYLRNVGRCQQNLGEPEKAIASFREYLRKARGIDARARAEIEGYIGEMEALARSRTAAASATAAPPPAAPPRAAPPPAPRPDSAAPVARGELTARPAAAQVRDGGGGGGDDARPGPVALFLRADFGVREEQRGVVLLPGLSLDVAAALELSGAAFLGHHKGALVGARAFLLPGRWRPNASLGVLALWPRRAGGAGRELRPGVQLGPGLRWQVARHLGLAADLTGTVFPGASGDFGSLWLVPSASVQGRL